MSFDISLSFQNIRKSLYEAVEIIISKFLSPHLAEDGGHVQYFEHSSRT
jgi:Fe-S cluster biogenesis protein NfuA